jgi:hypothetical protein
MSGRNVFSILKNIGTVPENEYPYGSESPPAESLYKLASQHKITFFARVMTIGGLKKAITQIGPCYLVLPLYKSRPYFWRPLEGETESEGHALVVVGYDDTGFILKNSWGSEWNNDGCIIFPYSDWNLHWECWACTDRNTRRVGSESGSLSQGVYKADDGASLDHVKQSIKATQSELITHIGRDDGIYEGPYRNEGDVTEKNNTNGNNRPRHRRRLTVDKTCTLF